MAEYVLLQILSLERRSVEQREMQHLGQWVDVHTEDGSTHPNSQYRRLPTLTLGVLGLGDIGTEIARTCSQGVRMKVVGCRLNPRPRASDAAAGVSHVFGLSELSQFLASSDYVVSVTPSTPETRGLLDGNILQACSHQTESLASCAAASASSDTPRDGTTRRRSAALINVGRGDLISEATVVEALDQGWISHFVGDVFGPEEPLPKESPLWSHPQVTVTPHNSAVTAKEDVVAAFVENLARYLDGGVEKLKNPFRWDAGY
jgi:phosphoglycerate dehydrogenase-like enzyme